jgi:transcriptional regulator with XRE-family HTH domain
VAKPNIGGHSRGMGASWKLLRAARLLLGITQRELAEEAKVSHGSIKRLEKGVRGHSRIDDAVQGVLERTGIKFLPESETSGGGLILPVRQPETPRSAGKNNDAAKPRKRGYTRPRTRQ